MSKTWPRVKLGDVLTHRKEFITIDDSQVYTRPRVQLHAQGIVKRDRLIGAEIKTKKQQICHAGDFLVAEIDAKMGGFGLVPQNLEGAIVSSHYFLFSAKPELLDKRFLGYFCTTPAFREQVEAQGSTNYAAIRPSHVLGYEMPLPPLGEQHRIVARVGAISKAAHNLAELEVSINETSAALFLSMHHSTANGQSVRLGDIIELHEEVEKIRADGTYPQVGVRGFGGGLFPKSPVAGTETTYKSYNRLYTDAIVLSQVKGWEGAIAVCPHDLSGMFVSPEYRTFRCKPGCASPLYLKELVRSSWFWELLHEATRGVGARRERVRPERFLSIRLHMPSFTEQERIVAAITSLDSARRLRKEMRLQLDALMPSVLQIQLTQALAF